MLPPLPCHAAEFSGNIFACKGDEGALGFLDLKIGLLVVGLQSGECSGLGIIFPGKVCEEKIVIILGEGLFGAGHN